MVLVNKEDPRIRVTIPDDKLTIKKHSVRCVEIYDNFRFSDWTVESRDNAPEEGNFETRMSEIKAEEEARKADDLLNSVDVDAVDKETKKSFRGRLHTKRGYVDKKVNDASTRRYRTKDLLLPGDVQFLQ